MNADVTPLANHLRLLLTVALRLCVLVSVGMAIAAFTISLSSAAQSALGTNAAGLGGFFPGTNWALVVLAAVLGAGHWLFLALGLRFFEKRLIRWLVPNTVVAKNICPACGYNVKNLNSPVCPECGEHLPISRPAILNPPGTPRAPAPVVPRPPQSPRGA